MQQNFTQNSTQYGLWYKEEGEKARQCLFTTIADLYNRQAYEETWNSAFFSLYGAGRMSGYHPFRTRSRSIGQSNIGINLVQIIISSLKAKIAKKKPRPYFLTDNQDWQKQSNAKALNRVMLGEFKRIGVYKKSPKTFGNSCIFGSGIGKVFNDGKRPCVDVVFPSEIKVDNREGLHGDPQNLYQVKNVPKQTLIDQFPNFEKEIMESSALNYRSYYYLPYEMQNMVTVVEAWHKGSNGKTMLATDKVTLYEGDWKRKKFPFAKYDFQDRSIGYWGKGVCELLMGLQMELNRQLLKISQSFWLSSTPRVYIDMAAEIVDSHINNQIGSIIKHSGRPPVFQTPTAVDPMFINYMQWVIQRAFEEIGLSELTATSQKPAGLQSGRALREFHDIETERFALLAQGYEDYHLDLADLIIDEIEELDGRKSGGYETLAENEDGDGAEIINWKQVKLERENCLILSYPSSLLPESPTGKLESISEMINLGIFTAQEVTTLLDYPDVNRVLSMKNSPANDIKRVINLIVHKGEYEDPMELQDLKLGVRMMTESYLYYKTKKLPVKNLQLFLKWIDGAMAIIKRSQQKAIQEQAMQQAGVPIPQGGLQRGPGEQLAQSVQNQAQIDAMDQQGLPV